MIGSNINNNIFLNLNIFTYFKMNSFILFYLFYLANFGYKIKADIPLKRINLNCESKYYFDSIIHECVECGKTVYNNICYHNNQSIYGFDGLIVEEGECKDDEILTELDDKGRYSGKLMCAKIKQAHNESVDQREITFSLETYDDIKRPENGHSAKPFSLIQSESDATLISYSIDACRNGQYEKSCQYLANLCTLNMYNGNSIFCRNIFEFENNKTL